MNKRYTYLDILRTFCIFGVLYCHSGYDGLYVYMSYDGFAPRLLGTMWAIIIHTCIPTFFMISGALLLNKTETFKQVYSKRVKRFIVVILLASLLQYAYNAYTFGFTMNIKDYLWAVYLNRVSTAYWYLYAYMSLLLVLPILQKIAQSLPDNYYPFIFIFFLSFWIIIPEMEEAFRFEHIALNDLLFSYNVILMLMGYYIVHRSGELFYKGRNVLITIAIALAFMLVEAKWNMYKESPYFDRSTCLVAFATFVTIRYLVHRWPLGHKAQKVWQYLGSGVFGAYLIELPLRNLCHPIIDLTAEHIGLYGASILWIFTACMVGIVIVNAVKLIPGVKKYL